jgi:hypothetical protein
MFSHIQAQKVKSDSNRSPIRQREMQIPSTVQEEKGGTASKNLLKHPNIFLFFSLIAFTFFFLSVQGNLSCPIAWRVRAFVPAALSLGLSFC